MRFKFKLFNNCLFCFKELPQIDERKGEGEHIIPKNIHGFWTSRDICEECKIYFGKNIDVIPKKNIQIIEAVKTLNIKNQTNFSEGIKYNALDRFTKEKLQMYKKQDKLKVKVNTNSEGKLNLDEKDILTVGLQHILNSRKDFLPEEEIKLEVIRMVEENLLFYLVDDSASRETVDD